MAPKERRKGRKEVHKDNMETLSFYLKFVLVGSVVQIAHIGLAYFLSGQFSNFNYVALVLALVIQGACYYSLYKMAAPELGPGGELVEAGMDLSDTYFSEYAIDFIILTTGIQVLSAISNYMWFLWLLGPMFLLYKGWVSIVWPWIKSGPEQNEDGERSKKKHKQRPKMRKVH